MCDNIHCVNGYIPIYDRKFDPEGCVWLRYEEFDPCLCCRTRSESLPKRLIEVVDYTGVVDGNRIDPVITKIPH